MCQKKIDVINEQLHRKLRRALFLPTNNSFFCIGYYLRDRPGDHKKKNKRFFVCIGRKKMMMMMEMIGLIS